MKTLIAKKISQATRALGAAFIAEFDAIDEQTDPTAYKYSRDERQFFVRPDADGVERPTMLTAYLADVLGLRTADARGMLTGCKSHHGLVRMQKERLAIKALTKVRQLYTAVMTGKAHECDPYTQAVLYNAVVTGRDSFTNTDARAIMSVFEVVPESAVFAERLTKATSTAQSQRNTTSTALHVVGAAVYDAPEALTTFNGSDIAQALFEAISVTAATLTADDVKNAKAKR